MVIIFDECHRSQAGEQHKRIRALFQKHHIFGFTGTPIFAENSRGQKRVTTLEDGTQKVELIDATVTLFGDCLHTHTIVPAIRDRKVLAFRIEQRDVNPRDKNGELVDIPLNHPKSSSTPHVCST